MLASRVVNSAAKLGHLKNHPICERRKGKLAKPHTHRKENVCRMDPCVFVSNQTSRKTADICQIIRRQHGKLIQIKYVFDKQLLVLAITITENLMGLRANVTDLLLELETTHLL